LVSQNPTTQHREAESSEAYGDDGARTRNLRIDSPEL
jgi:hypothetical protein